jgi:putative endonuclease
MLRSAMFYGYILANRKRGTLYTGVTGHLPARIHAHHSRLGSLFASKYGTCRLVCILPFATALEAIEYEKRLKKWRRAWKIQLIERDNADWRDLYDDLQRQNESGSREGSR